MKSSTALYFSLLTLLPCLCEAHFNDGFNPENGALIEIRHFYGLPDLEKMFPYSSMKPLINIQALLDMFGDGKQDSTFPYIDENLLCFHQMQWIETYNMVENRNQFRANAYMETEDSNFVMVPVVPEFLKTMKDFFADPEQVGPYYQDGKPWDPEYTSRRLQGWVNRWDFSPFSAWLVFNKTEHSLVMFFASYFETDKNSVQIAYIVDKKHRHKGIGKSVLGRFERYAKEYGFTCESIRGEEVNALHAPIHPGNSHSQDLVCKKGFSVQNFDEGANRNIFVKTIKKI